MYSSQVRRLLQELPNRGSCSGSTHMGRAENPVCGDVTGFQLKVSEDSVVECYFQAYGCPGAVAAAAGLTEIVKGRTLDFCRELSEADLLEFLGGLPKQKEHGVDLALMAFRKALAG